MRRYPSAAEWKALFSELGLRAAPGFLRENGIDWGPIPQEVKDLVAAEIALAQLDRRLINRALVATLPDPATQADDALVHLQEVAQRIGRSRRTVERRCRDRQIRLIKQGGRTYVHKDDIERLKD